MRIEHLINGKPKAARDYFETVNPATQEVLAEVASGSFRNKQPPEGPETFIRDRGGKANICSNYTRGGKIGKPLVR